MIFVCLLVISVVNFIFCANHGPVDCSMGSRSCDSCLAAYPFCYWCEGQCQRYYGKRIAQIECAGEVMYQSCSSKTNAKNRLKKMMTLLASLKKANTLGSAEHNYFGENFGPEAKPTESSKKARLLRVLKLLKLLAVLEARKKNSQKSTAESLKSSLGKLSTRKKTINNAIVDETSTEYPFKQNPNAKSNSDLEALLHFVEGKTTIAPPEWGDKNSVEKQSHIRVQTTTPPSTTASPKNAKILLATTSAEKELQHASTASVIMNLVTLSNQSFATSIPTTRSRYCELFENEDECNSDKECSWCNILSKCIGRHKEDFEMCTKNEKRSDLDDEDAEDDACSGMTGCKGCTSTGKCFWCEKTKSCHTYPFFGFIPHNCPANMWYYKECDVQLAIFIILFPLLMILVSMVIFYFCLRYCYYRKRTLKVQLFEKPELFERRKGKKVYFVGGDEEDDESRSEQIRKKYNLPHEKEPLISP